MEWLGDFPNRLPFSEAIGLGGSVTLMGVAIVFIALVCLIALTILYPKFFGWLLPITTAFKVRRSEKKALKKANKKLAVSNEIQKPKDSVSVSAPVSDKDAKDDGDLIAVITAAVAASLGTSSNGIRIRSLKRSGSNTPAWGREGKFEQFRF